MEAPLQVRDHAVETPAGRLFARSWQPENARGSPVVMFHDSLGSVELWRQFPALLAAATGRQVVAYDRLGFGRSDARQARPTLRFVAEETASFLTLRAALGIDRFVALGHSVGGAMAIECAAACPAACEAVVTLAAQVYTEERTLVGIRAAREQFADPAQVERLAKYHGEKAPWVLDAWIGNWLDPGFGAWHLRDVLPRVVAPVLAIHGDSDEYGSTAHPRVIEELAAGPVRVEVLPGVGHMPQREQTEATVGLVAQFLRGVG